MRIKSYSQLSEVQNDVRRLSKEFTRTRKAYLQTKSALATATLEVTAAGLKKDAQDRQFWKCFEYATHLAGLKTILSNIGLSLYHQFGEDDGFETTAAAVDLLRTKVSEETAGLESTIAHLAHRHAPRRFKREVSGLQTRLASLPCKGVAVEFQFVPAAKGLYFVSHLCFAHLKDQNGYTNPNFYVAVARFYGDGTPHMKVAVARGKKTPAQMTTTTPETLWDTVRAGLTAKNVSVESLA